MGLVGLSAHVDQANEEKIRSANDQDESQRDRGRQPETRNDRHQTEEEGARQESGCQGLAPVSRERVRISGDMFDEEIARSETGEWRGDGHEGQHTHVQAILSGAECAGDENEVDGLDAYPKDLSKSNPEGISGENQIRRTKWSCVRAVFVHERAIDASARA